MKLSKEQMFQFILDNIVTISPDTSGWWCRHDRGGNMIEKYRNKYRVGINDTCMSGMDLEEAIQYYHDNYEEQ